jgi:hypothetical protein
MGKGFAGQTVDISEGGVGLRTAYQMRIGEKGKLRIEGCADELPFELKYHEGNTLHVEFTFQGGTPAGFASFLRQRTANLKPLD